MKSYLKSFCVLSVSILLSIWMHLGHTPSAAEVSGRILNVEYIHLKPIDHQVIVKGWGQVLPWEQTVLSSQVAGRVIAAHEDFEPGQIVSKGTVLFELDPADYEPALSAAQADLALVQAMEQEEIALVEVAKSQWKGRKATSLALRKPQLASAEAKVAAAKARLVEARRDLFRTKVVAPFDALVRVRSLGVGQVLNVGQVVATLYNIDRARLVLPVAMFDLPFLSDTIDQPSVRIRLTDAADKNISRYAQISSDVGYVDEQTRMQQLMLVIHDPYNVSTKNNTTDGIIKFGSFVEADIPGTLLKEVFAVPQHLISNNLVWIVNLTFGRSKPPQNKVQ